MYLKFRGFALWARFNRSLVFGCCSYVGSYVAVKFLFSFALLLLIGTGNGYDECPLDSYFTVVVLELVICGITFEFWAGLCGQIGDRRGTPSRKEKVEGKSLAKMPYKPVV